MRKLGAMLFCGVIMTTMLVIAGCGGGSGSAAGTTTNNTNNNSSSGALKGSWGSGTSSLTFMADGTYQVNLNNSAKPDAWGTYSTTGNQLTIVDTGGTSACYTAATTTFDTGTYTWAITDGKLTLTLVSDSCSGRKTTLTAQTFTASSTSETTAPSLPAGLTVTVKSASQVDLSWTASTDSTGVKGYKVFRNGVLIASVTTTSYSDTGLTAGTAYSYTISAFDAAGNDSGKTAASSATTTKSSDTTAPTVPAGLTATAASSSQINLAWSASTDAVGVTGYRIYRSASAVGTSATASYSDTGLTASTQYCYQVAAYDAAGNESAKSTQACATTSAAGSSTTYSTADMNGTWAVHGLYAGDSGNSKWNYVTATSTNGAVQLTGQVETSGPRPDSSGTWAVSSDGTVSIPGNSSSHGTVSKSKNVEVDTGNSAGTPGLSVVVKKSGTFTTADLAGTWYGHYLAVGDGANMNIWMYDNEQIDANGVSTMSSIVKSTGSVSGTETKTYIIANDGTITVAGSTLHGQMNSDKNLIVFTISSTNGSYFMGVLVKAGATFTQADLAGNWVAHALAARDTGNRWGYATLNIDSTGNFPVSPWTVSSGLNLLESGQLVISSGGIVTVTGVSDVHGVLSADKNVLIIAGNTNSGQDRTLFVIVKR